MQRLQEQVEGLSHDEMAQFRAWFLEHDWADWDVHLEQDVQARRLDALAEQALLDHGSGGTTPL